MNMTAGSTNTAPPSIIPAAATQAPSDTTAPAAAPGKVSIANFAFDPAALTVKSGSTVTWTNNDVVAHTVTFTDVANSPTLNRGDKFSRTFTKAGTYSYICSIHPFMHGTVVVTL
jgi:amicyanin